MCARNLLCQFEEDGGIEKKVQFKSVAVVMRTLGIIIECLKCKSYIQGGLTNQDNCADFEDTGFV